MVLQLLLYWSPLRRELLRALAFKALGAIMGTLPAELPRGLHTLALITERGLTGPEAGVFAVVAMIACCGAGLVVSLTWVVDEEVLVSITGCGVCGTGLALVCLTIHTRVTVRHET